MAKRKLSQGIQCASFGCNSREYSINSSQRERTGISFFSFPLEDKKLVGSWCNLIKRHNNRDGFSVGKNKKNWNNFKAKRKLPLVRRTSPRKKPIKENLENDLTVRTEAVHIEPDQTRKEDNNISESHLLNDSEKEIASLKLLNEQLKLKNQELSKQLNSEEIPIILHIKLNNKNCNHYTGFKTLERLMAVFKFLDFGDNGENIILYSNQSNQETGRGRPRALSPFDSCVLTLMKLFLQRKVS